MANKSPLEEFVKIVDLDLEFVRFIGEGEYGIVFEVKLNDTNLALKVNKKNEAFQIDKQFTIENEFKVMKALEGIRGVPKVFKFYKKSPCLIHPDLFGKNAFLRELIPGKILDKSGSQRMQFFIRLSNLLEAMIQKGYVMIVDFGAGNILVGKDGYPYLIDMMCTLKLSSSKNIREQQINLFRKRFKEIQSRYLG